MPTHHTIWKVGGRPESLTVTKLACEDRLEDMIAARLEILSAEWIQIGWQEKTSFGGIIDLLAIAPDGSQVLIELKRDKAPREIVVQVLDHPPRQSEPRHLLAQGRETGRHREPAGARRTRRLDRGQLGIRARGVPGGRGGAFTKRRVIEVAIVFSHESTPHPTAVASRCRVSWESKWEQRKERNERDFSKSGKRSDLPFFGYHDPSFHCLQFRGVSWISLSPFSVQGR